MSQVDKPADRMNNLMGGVRANMNANGGHQRGPQHTRSSETALDTYIYDYFLKLELWDCARALLNARTISIKPESGRRESPGRRPVKHDLDGNPIENGDTEMGGTSTKMEDGEEGGRSFPQPDVPHGDFLLDWFLLFWDIYQGSQKAPGQANPLASAYVAATQQQKQFAQQRYMQRVGPQGMVGPVPGQMGYNPGMGRGVMMPEGADRGLIRTAVMNNNRNPMLMNRSASIPGGAREGEAEMNGQQRSQSPANAAGAANSPVAKRQNLGNGEYRDQNAMRRMQPGVSAPHQATNSAQQILIQSGIDPSQLTPQQFNNFQMSNAAGKKMALQEYASNIAAQHNGPMQNQMQHQQMVKMGQMPGQPMPHPGGDDRMVEFYNPQHPGHAVGGANGTPGNNTTHALADYQMQLMVLEQQNKKRLLKARAEQDNLTQGANGAQGMSPPGNRAQPSPQPSIDMKRGTPKLGPAVGPGSPLPDGQMQQGGPQQRQSPAAAGMQGFNGQGPQDPNGFYNPNASGGMQNGPNMRPPSSHPNGQNMQQMSNDMMGQNFRQQQQQAQAGRGQPGVWNQGGMQGQQPMGMQSGPQQGNQPAVAGGNRQGQGNMPGSMPPPAQPGAGGPRAPNSPSLGQAQPPTPTQANKAAPKAAKKQVQKRPPKKAANAQPQAQTAATPSSGPPTPTPTTPITPQHAQSFNNMGHINKNGGQFGGGNNGAQAGTSQAAGSAPVAPTAAQLTGSAAPQDNVSAGANDFSMGGDNEMFLMDNSNDTLLETFDFDSFLHSTDDANAGMGAFDTTFSFQDTVEAGAGES